MGHAQAVVDGGRGGKVRIRGQGGDGGSGGGTILERVGVGRVGHAVSIGIPFGCCREDGLDGDLGGLALWNGGSGDREVTKGGAELVVVHAESLEHVSLGGFQVPVLPEIEGAIPGVEIILVVIHDLEETLPCNGDVQGGFGGFQ